MYRICHAEATQTNSSKASRNLAEWMSTSIAHVSFDAAGLVALADLSMITERTALTGTASLLDIFVLAPGLHRQQNATDLNMAEYPPCAAMTTGYVFRVENQATVVYLQKVGRTGHLTNLSVEQVDNRLQQRYLNLLGLHQASWTALTPYFLCIFLTMVVVTLMSLAHDWWGLSVILVLCLCAFAMSL